VRAWLALLTLCGCNQAFNLESTKLIDAAEPPPPIDAPPPPVCPALGTVPRFSDELRQIPPRECEAYSVSENRIAMALCKGQLLRGDADGDMTQTIMMDPAYASDFPRLAPDGDHLFVSHVDYNLNKSEFVEFAWNGTTLDKVGSYTARLDTASLEYFSMSTPSRGPDRRIVYADQNMTTYAWELVEISDAESGKFAEVARYPMTELGDMVGPLEKPSLSADGLRLVFLNSSHLVQGGGSTGGGYTTNGASLGGYGGGWCTYSTSVVMYADRPNTSAHFGPAQVIDTVPDQVDWPYMTEDCGRIYLSALNRIFYFKQ
jgi:hypothetical protein